MIQLLCVFDWTGAGEVLLDAFLDSAIILPVLFLAHILMTVIDRYAGKKTRNGLKGPLSPLIGAAAGCLPQCGFSVAATRLYTKKYITLGALVAVYISTSDEAILILFSSGAPTKKILLLLGIKLAFALLAGYTLNLIVYLAAKNKNKRIKERGGEVLITCTAADDLNLFLYKEGRHEVPPAPTDLINNPLKQIDNPQTAAPCLINRQDSLKLNENGGDINNGNKGNEEGCGNNPDFHHSDCGCGCNLSANSKSSGFNTFVLHPLLHTLKIFAYVLAVNLILGFIIFFVTPQRFSDFISGLNVWQPFLAALVGLIPNCAAGVILAEMYAGGMLTFGAAVAGLSSAAGLGYAVLIKEEKNKFSVFLIIFGLGVFSAIAGVIVNLF